MATGSRSPEEIRASIEENRTELGQSLDRLRGEVVRLTDWRGQLRIHQQQVIIAAGVAGFVLGGGVAALGGATFGRRRRQPPPAEGWKQIIQLIRVQVDEFISELRS
jgi:hypothetical protein